MASGDFRCETCGMQICNCPPKVPNQSTWYNSETEKHIKALQAENKRLREENEETIKSATEFIATGYCKEHAEEVKNMPFAEFKEKDDNAGCIFCLQSDLTEAVKALELVKARGYNEDCILCGLKDRVVNDFLTRIEQKESVVYTIRDWAEAIAARISDEWSGREDFPEDAKLMEKVLTEALMAVPEECMKLVGTGIIEEGYFDATD